MEQRETRGLKPLHLTEARNRFIFQEVLAKVTTGHHESQSPSSFAKGMIRGCVVSAVWLVCKEVPFL